MQNKKGQIAIFVIVALAIVVGIIIFFSIRQTPVTAGAISFNPEQYIQQCISPSVNEAVDLIIPHGGFREPRNFAVYNHTNIEYLCKTSDNYEQCINIHPMYVNEISDEIKDYISPIVENCFSSLKTELEKRQASVEFGNTDKIEVSMILGEVFVSISKNVKITEKETTGTFDKFELKIASPIYNLARVAIDIANNERYCNFNIAEYVIADRSVNIKKFAMSDSIEIFAIRDKESGKTMNIAIRSCAI